RSEDVLLGIVAQWMHPSAWLVDLPFALPHERDTAKQWVPATANFKQELLHVLHGWINQHASAIVAESPEQRLRAIGSLLLDFSASGDARLQELLRQHAVEAGSQTLFAISEQLDDAELPARWKEQLVPWLRSPAFSVDRASVEGRL